MANDFLLRKWRAIFHVNDINKDNIITIEDAELFTDRFATHHKFSAEQTTAAKEKFRYFWRECFLKDQDKVTEEMFLDTLTKEYNADPVKFRANQQNATSVVTNIFDVNQDGCISEQELAVCMRCWGVEQNFDKKFIQSYPQRKPGFVHNDDYTESFVEYMCNGDENVITKEKPVIVALNIVEI
ncbi:sarcoplasmic calcium-binding protein-like [Mercenaria mercenaria]|uniref:sarcoplasmic calcium-binding protein-like n=1 Tax=Mercenaria mercenaria TaxID=6596 RepID=UPI001E1D3821|nr:sarcoplasmic calcium-binding protein-like [Mercenaria mercenaria]